MGLSFMLWKLGFPREEDNVRQINHAIELTQLVRAKHTRFELCQCLCIGDAQPGRGLVLEKERASVHQNAHGHS